MLPVPTPLSLSRGGSLTPTGSRPVLRRICTLGSKQDY
nr:MAG TPA: hypothetical protein [Caudoviricetes sp.]